MILNQPKPSIERICSNLTTGLAWIEPNGKVHWLNPRNTHGQWAYFYKRPERDDGTWAPVEDWTTYNELISAGWIRVSNILHLTVDELDTPPPAAWDAWALMMTDCKRSADFSAEDSQVIISAGRMGMGGINTNPAEAVERFCSRRGKDAFWSSMMSESLIRNLIRSILSEDLAGFRKKAASQEYSIDIEEDPTFEENPEARKKARSLKTAWKEEADHKFMDSVTKIHWMKDVNPEKMRKFLTYGRKDEISTMGYLKPPYTNFGWGGVGFQLQGRTTIAHNDMDQLYTGYFSGPGQFSRRWKYRDSGVPKRPKAYRDAFEGAGYILDEESFNPTGQGYNEFLVDNWKPIGFILTESTFNILKDVIARTTPDKWREFEGRSPITKGEMWTQIFRMLEEFGIPFMKRKQSNLAKEWLSAASKTNT